MYKKNIIFPILLASILLIVGCRPSADHRLDASDGVTVVADNFEESEQTLLSAFVDTFRVIPLETNSNCLLNGISKVKVTRDGIFVQDARNRAEHIYRFDSNGRFLNVVGHLGQGPEECLDITSFAVDGEKGLVYIHSRSNGCLMVYKADGSFVRRISVDYRAFAIEYVDHKVYLGGGNGSRNLYNLIAVDAETGRVLEEYNPSRNDYAGYEPRLQAYGGELYYYPNEARDTVYRAAGNDVLDVAFRLDWGEHTLPDAVWEKQHNAKNGGPSSEETIAYNQLLWKKRYIAGIDKFAVFGPLFYFQFSCGGVYNGFYNRKTGEVTASTSFDDDVSPFSFSFIGQTDTELISIYDGNDVDRAIEFRRSEDWQKDTGTSPEKAAEMVKCLEDLKARLGEDPNPVLVFYRVK